MMAGGCCLAMRMCRLSSCALSRPLAVLFLRVQSRHSTMHSFVGIMFKEMTGNAHMPAQHLHMVQAPRRLGPAHAKHRLAVGSETCICQSHTCA